MEKVALVTGSSSGIGLETALALARDGFHTFASMRDVGKAGELEHAAKKENLSIDVIELDVDKEESIVAAIKKVSTDGGSLDVLVNNAGYGQFGCTEDVSIDDFRKQFETNFFSIVRIIKEVAPIMRKQNSGIIVNISSVVGRIGLPASPAYISTKFALARDLGPENIRVNSVLPGWIMTERQIANWLTPEAEEELMREQCIKRKLYPDDIARVVLFFAADDSAACTNQSYIADGGWV